MGTPDSADGVLAFNSAIATRITQTLDARRLSVSWLSRAAGIPNSTLDRALDNPIELKLAQTGKIAVALDVDYQWLMCGIPSMVVAA